MSAIGTPTDLQQLGALVPILTLKRHVTRFDTVEIFRISYQINSRLKLSNWQHLSQKRLLPPQLLVRSPKEPSQE